MNINDLLTTKQAAERLGMTPQRIRQIAEERKIGRKMGRDWFFSTHELEQLQQPASTGRPRGGWFGRK